MYVSHAESKKCSFTQLLAQELESSSISYVVNGRGALPAGAAGAAPDALARSARVGTAIISPAFIQREQPKRELDIFLQVARPFVDMCAVTPSLLPSLQALKTVRPACVSNHRGSAPEGQLVTDVSLPPYRAARHAAAGVRGLSASDCAHCDHSSAAQALAARPEPARAKARQAVGSCEDTLRGSKTCLCGTGGSLITDL